MKNNDESFLFYSGEYSFVHPSQSGDLCICIVVDSRTTQSTSAHKTMYCFVNWGYSIILRIVRSKLAEYRLNLDRVQCLINPWDFTLTAVEWKWIYGIHEFTFKPKAFNLIWLLDKYFHFNLFQLDLLVSAVTPIQILWYFKVLELIEWYAIAYMKWHQHLSCVIVVVSVYRHKMLNCRRIPFKIYADAILITSTWI